jgi:hypothetical protein
MEKKLSVPQCRLCDKMKLRIYEARHVGGDEAAGGIWSLEGMLACVHSHRDSTKPPKEEERQTIGIQEPCSNA